jgi:hypothetical protein
VTVWSLVLQIRAALRAPLGVNASSMNALVGMLLLVLAVYLAVQCAQSIKSARTAQVTPAE